MNVIFQQLILVVLISLTGCVGPDGQSLLSEFNVMNTSYDPKTFNPNKQAIVVLRAFCESQDAQGNIKSVIRLQPHWDNGNKKFIVNRTPFAKWETNVCDYLILVVEPGFYELKKFKLLNGMHKDRFGVSPKGVTFTVNSGDIVYLGDFIMFDYFKGTFEIRDSFDEAKKLLLQTYPALASKIKKNLMNISKTVSVSVPSDFAYMSEVWEEYKHLSLADTSKKPESSGNNA